MDVCKIHPRTLRTCFDGVDNSLQAISGIENWKSGIGWRVMASRGTPSRAGFTISIHHESDSSIRNGLGVQAAALRLVRQLCHHVLHCPNTWHPSVKGQTVKRLRQAPRVCKRLIARFGLSSSLPTVGACLRIDGGRSIKSVT